MHDIELEKSFIRDVIKQTPLSRTQIIVDLKRREHIGDSIWAVIGEFERSASVPSLDFLANLPAHSQQTIALQMRDHNLSLHDAITAATGEVLLDDAVYLSELVASWNAAPAEVRARFLKGIMK